MTSPLPGPVGSGRAWALPTALLGLCIVPVAAGVGRLIMLGTGAPVTPANARFFAAPAPVALHILGACVYAVGGALQFAAPLRRRRSFHRRAGRIVTLGGLATAATGLWMTLFYPRAPGDTAALSVVRVLVGSAMLVGLVLGFRAIRRRDFQDHSAWMTRAYALGLGAGTQALLHLPWLAVGHPPRELGHTLLMVAGWAINVAIAEVAVHRRRAPGTAPAGLVLER